MSKLLTKISTTAVTIATVVSISGGSILMPAIAHGATVAELQKQIADLLALITGLQNQLSNLQGGSSGSVPASLLSSGNLTVGSKGAVVKDLQKYLNGNGFQVATDGAGSAGNETEYFGPATKVALAKWQAARGISPASGYFGPVTRAKLSQVGAASTPSTTPSTTPGTTPTPTVTPVGSGLTVTLHPSQPAAALAPFNATRIPFTKVQLTASADGDVTVTSLKVRRVGLAEDASLSGILLIDENGVQLGLEKTLSSDHEATIGESTVIKAGQTRTFTISARRAAAGSRGGQTISIAVVSVNTTATVFGLDNPLVGATHTINETLTVGSLTSPSAGALDPGGSQTKEIGTAGYTFASVKFTAGSAEKVRLMSIRWNQTGSAAKSDLTNVQSSIDGTTYDVVVSADGKFYTSTFGTGIVVDKGFSKEISIKGNISGGSARKVDFDVDKRSDIYAIGETFGYGILAADGTDDSGTDDGAFHLNTNPWYDSFEVHVSAGTIQVSKWNGVEAQNVSVNLADQPIGGWTVDVKGEPITVGQIIFQLSTSEANSGTAVGVDDIDNITIVDDKGSTLAGPLDAAGTTTYGTVTFTDTITFPVGLTNIKMVAKLTATNGFDTNDTIAASSTPSTQWSSVTGQVTGNSITPSPTSSVTGNTMTVKAGALTISVSSVPIAQTVIAGVKQFEFAKYILDATGSGEDVRLTSLPIEYSVGGGGTANRLTNCTLYDGTTVLQTGSNVQNPTAAASSTSFVFNGTGYTLVKGTSKQLSLKCDLASGSTGIYTWGYDTTASPSPTGLTSGQTITATENDSVGQSMTVVAGGSLAVLLDETAAYKIVAPGQTVELLRLKYTATNENVDVNQVALQLGSTASNTPINLVGQMVTLWDGTTQIGEATFSNSGSTADFATSSALTAFRVPKDGSKILTVKGTIAGVTTSGPMTQSGDLLIVNYDGHNEGTSSGNQGTGVDSGTKIAPANDDTSSTGVRIMRAYPVIEAVALTTSERTLEAKDGELLYKFKVTATNGDISMYKWTFSVSSSTGAGASSNATTTKFALYVYEDAFVNPAGGFTSSPNSDGLVNAGSCFSGLQSNTAAARTGGNLGANSALVEIFVDKTGCNQGTTSLKISSGTSRWFALKASVGTLSPSGTSDSIQVQLEGDAAFPTVHQKIAGGISGQMGRATSSTASGGVDDDTNNDFIWSPRSTSSTESDANYIYNLDWTNGYGVQGLPSTNLSAETISK